MSPVVIFSEQYRGLSFNPSISNKGIHSEYDIDKDGTVDFVRNEKGTFPLFYSGSRKWLLPLLSVSLPSFAKDSLHWQEGFAQKESEDIQKEYEAFLAEGLRIWNGADNGKVLRTINDYRLPYSLDYFFIGSDGSKIKLEVLEVDGEYAWAPERRTQCKPEFKYVTKIQLTRVEDGLGARISDPMMILVIGFQSLLQEYYEADYLLIASYWGCSNRDVLHDALINAVRQNNKD
jgi:hypothetical protein